MTAIKYLKKTLILGAVIAFSVFAHVSANAQGVTLNTQRALTTNELRVVVITDPVVLKNFTLERTVGQIQTTAGKQNTSSNRNKFIKSLVDSFKKTSGTNTSVTMPLTPRLAEQSMLPADILNPAHINGLNPVAVTNRLDLMPSDYSNCGEQRIIYEKTNTSDRGRMTLIFEAVISNPNPSMGLSGCLSIAKFWAGLGAPNLSQSTLATRLENFFYKGMIPGEATIKPPVHFSNYGNPLGQIRINTFMDPSAWLLREYVAGISTDGLSVTLKVTANNNSIWKELYNPITPNDSSALQTSKTECQKDFSARDFKAVTSVEAGVGATGEVNDQWLITRLGMNTRAKCNGLENNSSQHDEITSPPDLMEVFRGNLPLVEAVDAAIAANKSKWPYPLSWDLIFNRINTQSCAGCHELSNGMPIAPLKTGSFLTWPRSAGFVHIDESGNLSDLLKKHFLPERFTLVNTLLMDNGGGGGEGIAAALTPSGVERVSSSVTVQETSNVQSLQQKILSGTLSQTVQESLIAQARIREQEKFGALIKNRPTH